MDLPEKLAAKLVSWRFYVTVLAVLSSVSLLNQGTIDVDTAVDWIKWALGAWVVSDGIRQT